MQVKIQSSTITQTGDEHIVEMLIADDPDITKAKHAFLVRAPVAVQRSRPLAEAELIALQNARRAIEHEINAIKLLQGQPIE
jgi:hypothetical protein